RGDRRFPLELANDVPVHDRPESNVRLNFRTRASTVSSIDFYVSALSGWGKAGGRYGSECPLIEGAASEAGRVKCAAFSSDHATRPPTALGPRPPPGSPVGIHRDRQLQPYAAGDALRGRFVESGIRRIGPSGR